MSLDMALCRLPPATEMEEPIVFLAFELVMSRKSPRVEVCFPAPGASGGGSARLLLLRTYVPHWLVGNAFVDPRRFTLNRIVPVLLLSS